MNKILFSVIAFVLLPVSTMASDVCGRVTQGSKNAQLIPVKGKTLTHLDAESVLSCGAMLITHEDAVWIELSDLTVFKIAPNSFFEFSKKGAYRQQLYRGEVLVTAPPSIREFEITTPNSISVFHGGVMLLRYQQKEKETTVASFNRKIIFKNKFQLDAEQVVSTGEMSRLWVGESKIAPSQPEAMNPRTVKVAVQGFALTADEETELTAVVQRTVENRSKALVADLESWEDLEREKAQPADRFLASVPSKKESSIDPKEAEIGLSLMKKHLFGDEEDAKILNDSRVPASVHEKLKDTEYQRKKAKEKRDTKHVLEEIRNFDPEND